MPTPDRGWLVFVGCVALLGCGRPPAPPRAEVPAAPGVIDRPAARGEAPSLAPPVDDGPAVPLSGGTLIVLRDGVTAVAADPDRDRVWVVDLSRRVLSRTIVLQPGDEPGRLIEDPTGRVHVALRRAGELLTFDVRTGEVLAQRPVCPAPRGLAHDPVSDEIVIACATGELVTIDPDPESVSPARTTWLLPDLRDVVVLGAFRYVSRFRSAEILAVSRNGTIARREILPAPAEKLFGGLAEAAVAWRMLPASGGFAVLHQRATAAEISVTSYGNTDDTIVQAALTRVQPGAPTLPGVRLARAVLAVDFAFSRDGKRFGFIAAGNAPFTYQIRIHDVESIGRTAVLPEDKGGIWYGFGEQFSAVAFDGRGDLIAQSREPAGLRIVPAAGGVIELLSLPGGGRADVGHTLFHTAPARGAALACASCHPEGGEDGRTWRFRNIGSRRTQSLRGGIAGTAPFHWSGDEVDFYTLFSDVFVKRMSGDTRSALEIAQVGSYIEAIPRPAARAGLSADAVERGKLFFHDPLVRCASCHSGPRLTNNLSFDVGTQGQFQVPSLRGVAARTPLMHDGCARTLRDRFGPCGGGDKHGRTSQLKPQQVDDLVAYLESL